MASSRRGIAGRYFLRRQPGSIVRGRPGIVGIPPLATIDRHAVGIRAKIMILNQDGFAIPFGAGIFEVANLFLLLRIDTDDGKALAGKLATSKIPAPKGIANPS